MKSSPSQNTNDLVSPSFDVVRFERVGFRYDRGPEILSDVNMRLRRGSFTFLTGASGAGKSTLLKLCYLNLKPSRGLINLFENDISVMSREEEQATKRRVGVVLQDFRLIDHLSVFENVALPLTIAGKKRAEAHAKADELLTSLGLGDRVYHRPGQLSGGEQQRVAIARALANDPKLLFADEPTGNLDPKTSEEVFDILLEQTRERGIGALIATHNHRLADDMDRGLELRSGKIAAF